MYGRDPASSHVVVRFFLFCAVWATFLIFPTLNAAEPSDASTPDPQAVRRQLAEFQRLTRRDAVSKGLLSQRAFEPYYSAALETDSLEVLRAHARFEDGCRVHMDGDATRADALWRDSAGLLETLGPEHRAHLRRVKAALALAWLEYEDEGPGARGRVEGEAREQRSEGGGQKTEEGRQDSDGGLGDAALPRDHHSGRGRNATALPSAIAAEPPPFERTLFEAAEVIRSNGLPSSEFAPAAQMRLEHWIASAARLLRTLRELEASAAGTAEDQRRIAREAFREICAQGLLLRRIVAESPYSDHSHEAFLDRVLFGSRLETAYRTLFENVKTIGEGAPGTVRPAWTALLAGWTMDASGSGFAEDALRRRDLSATEHRERFVVLADMILVADQYRLEDAWKKLAGGLAQLRPEHCPADRTALVFAETLLEGGHFDEAERYLALVDGEAEFAARALEIRLRSLVMRNRADEAVELAHMTRMTPEGVATEPGVLLWLARAHEKRGDHREAIDRYREFIELTPEAEEAPGAALMAGLMALNLRNREEAHGFFQTTITRYPASREAERARHFLVGQP